MTAMQHHLGKRYILKLNLAHYRVSRHYQRLDFHTTSLASSRTTPGLICDKIAMMPCANLPTRPGTTSDITISSTLVIHHSKVRLTVFHSFLIDRKTTPGRCLVPWIHASDLGSFVRSTLAIASVSTSHCLTTSMTQHCLSYPGTFHLDHLWPKECLLQCRKGCIWIGVRVSPTDTVHPEKVKSLAHRLTSGRKRLVCERRSFLVYYRQHHAN
jgi:hypothetical protein